MVRDDFNNTAALKVNLTLNFHLEAKNFATASESRKI